VKKQRLRPEELQRRLEGSACLQSYSTVKKHLCKNAVNENVFKNNVIIINRFYLSIHFY